MKSHNRRAAVSAALLSALLMLSTFGLATMNGQGNAQAPRYSGGPETGNPRTIDDATLKRTAAAYVRVRDIALKTQQAMGTASDQDTKQRMVEQAESEKVAAVKSEGIEPQQYNQVILAVRNNNDLRQKFLSYVRQAKGGSTSGSP